MILIYLFVQFNNKTDSSRIAKSRGRFYEALRISKAGLSD